MGACTRSRKKKPDEEATSSKKNEKVIAKDGDQGAKNSVKLTDDALTGEKISASAPAPKSDSVGTTPAAVKSVTPTIKIPATSTTASVTETTAATTTTGGTTTVTATSGGTSTVTDTADSTDTSEADSAPDATWTKIMEQISSSFEGIWFKATSYPNNSFWSWETFSGVNNFFGSSYAEFKEDDFYYHIIKVKKISESGDRLHFQSLKCYLTDEMCDKEFEAHLFANNTTTVTKPLQITYNGEVIANQDTQNPLQAIQYEVIEIYPTNILTAQRNHNNLEDRSNDCLGYVGGCTELFKPVFYWYGFFTDNTGKRRFVFAPVEDNTNDDEPLTIKYLDSFELTPIDITFKNLTDLRNPMTLRE